MRKYLAAVFVLLAFTSAALAHTAGFDDVDRASLIKSALAVQKNSYAPYSHFNVSAAVLCGSGKVYTGVNVENASYAASLCSIRNAVFHAVAEGERTIRAVAAIGGADHVITEYAAPCGICLQVMREFGNPKDVLVIMAKSEDDYIEMTLEQLFPVSFGPEFLK